MNIILQVVLISGKAESGKDLIAKSAKEYLEQNGKKCLIVKFGDILKTYLISFFDWDGKKDENGRNLLQETGQGFKKVLGNPYYWAERLFDIVEYKQSKEKYDFILIPDWRFIEEFEEAQIRYTPILIRVERDAINHLNQQQKNHISETELDDFEEFDLIIKTNNIEEKKEKMNKFLENLL